MFYGHHAGRFGGHGGAGVVGWIIPLLLFALVIGLVVFAVTRLTSHHGPWPRAAGPVGQFGPGGPVGPGGPGGPRFGPPDAAAEQVRFRYARGEMSRDEYFRVMGDLGWGAAPSGPAAGPFGPPPPPPPSGASQPPSDVPPPPAPPIS